MTAAFAAELRILRATRALVLVVVSAVVVSAIAAMLTHASALTGLLHTETVVLSLFVLIAGVIAGAGDYQHRTLQWTLLGTPRRDVAAGGKLLASAFLGALTALAVLAATWAAGTLASGGLAAGTPIAGLLAGQAALGALTGAFGSACGLALRNLPGAVAAVFTMALVLPLVFQAKAALDGVVRFLPYGEMSAAGLALGHAPGGFGAQLAPGAAALVMLAWTTAVGAIAVLRFRMQSR